VRDGTSQAAPAASGSAASARDSIQYPVGYVDGIPTVTVACSMCGVLQPDAYEAGGKAIWSAHLEITKAALLGVGDAAYAALHDTAVVSVDVATNIKPIYRGGELPPGVLASLLGYNGYDDDDDPDEDDDQ
jgi:hypothetical protein